MKTISRTILVICCFTLRVAVAQEKPIEGDLERLRRATDRCVAALSNEKFTNVFQGLLKEYWGKPDEAVSRASALENQYNGLRRQVELQAGKLLVGAYEFLGMSRLGKSLTRFIYVQKYEHVPFPIGFEYYKAQDQWKLTSVMIGGNPKDDLTAFAITGPAELADAELERVRQATDRCVA